MTQKSIKHAINHAKQPNSQTSLFGPLCVDEFLLNISTRISYSQKPTTWSNNDNKNKHRIRWKAHSAVRTEASEQSQNAVVSHCYRQIHRRFVIRLWLNPSVTTHFIVIINQLYIIIQNIIIAFFSFQIIKLSILFVNVARKSFQNRQLLN